MRIQKSRITKITVLLLLMTLVTSMGNVFINKVSAETFKIQGQLIPMSGEGSLCIEFWIEEAYSGKQIDLNNELIIGKNNDYVFNISLFSQSKKGLATWLLDGVGCDFDRGNNIEYLPQLKLNDLVLAPVGVYLNSDDLYILRYTLDSTKNNDFGQQKIQTITFDTNHASNGNNCYMAFYDYEDGEASENYNFIYRTSCNMLKYGTCNITIDLKSPIIRIGALGAGTETEFKYYKKQDILQINAYSQETLYLENLNDTTNPEIYIKFGNGEFIKPTFKRVDVGNYNITVNGKDETHKNRYVYEYQIQEEDAGQLALFFGDSKVYDKYGNEATYNLAYGISGEGFKGNYIFADSKVPIGTVTTKTNKDKTVTATVSFDEKNVIITNNEGENTYKFTENGEFTFTFKDQAGNEGSVKVEVTSIQKPVVKEPEVKFKTLKTKEKAGKVYVIVGQTDTVKSIKLDIDTEALVGKTIKIENLAVDEKLKTGSTITIDGKVQCVIVVRGDVDGNGEITFLGDIIRANNYRLELINIGEEQQLASDINDDGEIDFIKDLTRINNCRLGLIDSL